MNAYRNGALESVSIAGWIASNGSMNSLITGMHISKKDHEEMYGDKKLASEMEKEDLER